MRHFLGKIMEVIDDYECEHLFLFEIADNENLSCRLRKMADEWKDLGEEFETEDGEAIVENPDERGWYWFDVTNKHSGVNAREITAEEFAVLSRFISRWAPWKVNNYPVHPGWFPKIEAA